MALASFESSAFWAPRLRASALHLGLSLIVAGMAATLVFFVWYPYPYREISGGRELFVLVVTVDVILGPLITLAVFNTGKGWTKLRFDLAVIAALQLGALGYGMWTVFVARPVHLVFEYSRFSVAHAIDIPADMLKLAPPPLAALPLMGPTTVSLRPFKDQNEKVEATVAALQGLALAVRPDLWQPYEKAIPDVLKEAKPVTLLKTRFPNRATEIDQVLAPYGAAGPGMVYVPMVGRKSFWTVILDPVTAEIKAFFPLDSF